MTASPMQARAQELGLRDDDIAAWEQQVAADVVAALLSSLIRFEDALRELSR